MQEENLQTKNLNELKSFLINNNFDFSFDKESLEKFSEDTSLFKIYPKLIIFPKSKFQIQKLLLFINKNKNFSITSRSGGTDMSGGALTDSIVLSFSKYFNNIISINKDLKEAQVETGVYYRDFEKETLKSSLILPSFPASREICAIGGMVSNNSGGEKSLEYGKTEKYVKELEVILSNGEIVNLKVIKEKDLINNILNGADENFKNTLEYFIYKEIYNLVKNPENQNIIKRNTPVVSKNSAGYYLWNVLKNVNEENVFDLSSLIVGSQGTLAINTKVKLNLVDTKKYSKMILIFLKDLKDLSKVRDVVMRYSPESFESYDDNTFKVALKFLPSLIKKIFSKNNNKKEKNTNLFKIFFSFWKEVWLLISFGMPKLFLLAEFTSDDEDEILSKVLKVEIEIKSSLKDIKTEVIKTDFEAEKYWTIRRESFNLLREKVKGYHTAPFIDDIIVKGEDLKVFLEELIPILNKYNLFYTIAGHVGDGNLHIIPLMNFDAKQDKEKNIKTIKECSHEVYNLIKKYHGSTTAEHNDGLIRTPFLNEIYDEEMLDLFRKVKNIFDPNNILNPGKKVSIDKDLNKEFENNLKYIKF